MIHNIKTDKLPLKPHIHISKEKYNKGDCLLFLLTIDGVWKGRSFGLIVDRIMKIGDKYEYFLK